MAIIHQTGNCIIYIFVYKYVYIHFCVYIQQYSVLNFGRFLRAATQIPGQILGELTGKNSQNGWEVLKTPQTLNLEIRCHELKDILSTFNFCYFIMAKTISPYKKKLYLKKHPKNPRSIQDIPGPKTKQTKTGGGFNPWLQGDTTSGGATSGGATSLSSTKSTGFRAAFSKKVETKRNQTVFFVLPAFSKHTEKDVMRQKNMTTRGIYN